MHDSIATLVTIRLVYLARLRDAFGLAGEALAVPADEPPTGARGVDTLRARGGAFASELAPGRAVRYAVNHRLAPLDQVIASGDEIAILPPVTGG
jgi:molybdopterin synthase sulfur carrier subunit